MTAFGPLFVPEHLLAADSDRAWFEAMLEFERALDHRRGQHATTAVPDHDDLLGGVRLRGLDKTVRAGLDMVVEA